MAPIPAEYAPSQLNILYDCSECVIDISNNKDSTRYQDLQECPICFDPIISNDSLFTLSCCNQKVHLKCLCYWYDNNIDNTSCFMCNQDNPFGDTIFPLIEPESSNEIVSISNQDANAPSHRLIRYTTQEQDDSHEQSSTACCIILAAVIVFAASIIITIIIFM